MSIRKQQLCARGDCDTWSTFSCIQNSLFGHPDRACTFVGEVENLYVTGPTLGGISVDFSLFLCKVSGASLRRIDRVRVGDSVEP